MEFEQIGKYRIVKKIGQGATGEVYRAHDPILNRFVAVKTLSASIGANEERVKRFRREAQSAARLNHPNIVTVYDFGEEHGRLYMAMELLEGRDLSDVIRSGELGLEANFGLMEQICDALSFAHAMGVVHRDLKPANIHVQQDGQVKVMDFGLARLGGASDMTRAGAVMGTPNYMAPEQVRGERVDARADVFSLGAVFHEMLSGRKAFEAESLHSVLYKVLDEPPPPLSEIAPEVPPGLAAFVERALEKDPERRFRDGTELREALRHLRDASEIAAGDSTLATDRSSPGHETLAGAESTLLPGAVSTHPSLARSRSQPVVTGATALNLEPASAPHNEARPRPATPTLSGRSATRMEAAQANASRRWLFLGVAGVGLLAVGVGVLIVRFRGDSSTTSPDVSREQAGVLSETLVDSRVELARIDLQNKEYEAAIRQAEQALKIQPTSAAARAMVDEARGHIAERDAAAKDGQEALARGDTERASQALTRLLALDPRNPAAGELSGALNQYFTRQADEARGAMELARTAAQRQAGSQLTELAEAQALAREAQRLLGERQFAVATQKFLESRDAFERGRRAAEIAAQKASAPASPRTAENPSARPPIYVPPVTMAPLPPPTLPPTLASQPPRTLPSSVAPPAVGVPPQEAAIRRVVADYARAIEAKDVELFKSVKPNLSADDAKRLQEAFKAMKSLKVGITIDSVQVEGGKAAVHIHRADTINGKEMKAAQQTLTLALSGGAWHIETIGQ